MSIMYRVFALILQVWSLVMYSDGDEHRAIYTLLMAVLLYVLAIEQERKNNEH